MHDINTRPYARIVYTLAPRYLYSYLETTLRPMHILFRYMDLREYQTLNQSIIACGMRIPVTYVMGSWALTEVCFRPFRL